jgi:hypothetical protein
MSLTSCFKYVIELPEDTLTSLLRSVIAQGETSGLPLTYEDDGVPVDDYTARISASLVDTDAKPSTFNLTAAVNSAVLGLHMDIEVTINELPGVDPIAYMADFTIPGRIARNDAVAPVQIEFQAAMLTVADLNLVVSGGDIVVTGALFEPFVDQMYADSPSLRQQTIPGVDTVIDGIVLMRVWLYNDPVNGEIVVNVPSPGTLRLTMPGRITMTNVSAAVIYNFTITLVIDIDYVIEPSASGGEEFVVKLSQILPGDVTVQYGPGAPIYQALMTIVIGTRIVATLTAIPNPREPVPSSANVETQIAEALVEFGSGLVVPLFPLDPTASDIAIATAEPTTVNAATLALQIESEPGQPCVGPDDFTAGSPVAIAMGAVEVQRRLDAVADDIDGQQIEASGYDVTLHRPNVSLANAGDHGQAEGHIWVEGDVTIHVGGCVGDVGADYSGPIMLDPVVNPDQSIGFSVRAGEFGGDADVKDKKDDFDPDKVAEFIEGWDFSFPTIPTVFDGVGTLTLSIDTSEISQAGIVLRGGVSIQLLNMIAMGLMHRGSAFWAQEGAGSGGG